MTPVQTDRCADCGTEIAPGLMSCPSCARLVHADRLTELASNAERAESEGRLTDALQAWREALPYLPPGTRQSDTVRARIVELSGGLNCQAKQPWWKRLSALGPIGIAAAFLGKAKFLLLGFTKMGTLLSFLVGLSVYWALWGWKFALCFLLSIYVHEMGHVAALHRYGLPASPPMFIPGFGAFVRLKQHPATVTEDARIGLAGPIWGLCAALFALGLYQLTGNALWSAVARAGAWVNLFNLIPVWQLDGSRGIRSLNRMQIWMLAFLSAAMWMVVEEGMLILLALGLAYRAYTRHDQADPDWTGLLQFCGLIVSLSMLCLIPIPARP